MDRDIHKRIYKLVLEILKLLRKTPKTSENILIIKQLARSATSVGANDQEADGAQTKKDFIHKYSIVKKEAKESIYWLRLIGDLNPKLKDGCNKLMEEIEEVIKIISSIIYKTRQKSPNNQIQQ